jgi:plasmid stabilization system protein ParE
VKLRILDEAQAELRSAMHYYEASQQGLGLDLYERVAECMATIEKNPERFPFYEGVRTKLGVRRALIDRFPYLIAYKILTDEVLVIAIAHVSQRPAYWRRRAKNR